MNSRIVSKSATDMLKMRWYTNFLISSIFHKCNYNLGQTLRMNLLLINKLSLAQAVKNNIGQLKYILIHLIKNIKNKGTPLNDKKITHLRPLIKVAIDIFELL